ncbi:hypothetical protein [Bradyrhizobium iriomotense]|uniref:hypothetical protein n=1 Tax=Bradyrhizobium iriomotense TaxID=441950 RepID=UPI0024E118F1|nr:hypothetical protein [Bradyrhizobium iriomotense]
MVSSLRRASPGHDARRRRDSYFTAATRSIGCGVSDSKILGNENAGEDSGYSNEGVGEHVRTRFHFGRKATHEIAEPIKANRTERRKLVSSAGPDLDELARQGRTIRPLT